MIYTEQKILQYAINLVYFEKAYIVRFQKSIIYKEVARLKTFVIVYFSRETPLP